MLFAYKLLLKPPLETSKCIVLTYRGVLSGHSCIYMLHVYLTLALLAFVCGENKIGKQKILRLQFHQVAKENKGKGT